MTHATWSPDDRAWLDAHPGEGLPPDPYWHTGPGVFGKPFGHGLGVSRKPSSIPSPDEPSIEEIAHAANTTVPPLKHRPACALARAAKRGELVAEGQMIAQREGMREETIVALANVTRIGTGR